MFPEARTFFVSPLIRASSDGDGETILYLEDRDDAARIRDHIAAELKNYQDLQVLVLDLAGVSFTPSSLQELILPFVQRIRGGEYGAIRLVASTDNPGVSDFIRYMAQAHDLPIYVSNSPFDLPKGTPVGALTETGKNTLNTIIGIGGNVTASGLAENEGINRTASANRLANLDREGYLVRQPRGRRQGDRYFEPRSLTSTPADRQVYDSLIEPATGH